MLFPKNNVNDKGLGKSKKITRVLDNNLNKQDIPKSDIVTDPNEIKALQSIQNTPEDIIDPDSLSSFYAKPYQDEIARLKALEEIEDVPQQANILQGAVDFVDDASGLFDGIFRPDFLGNPYPKEDTLRYNRWEEEKAIHKAKADQFFGESSELLVEAGKQLIVPDRESKLTNDMRNRFVQSFLSATANVVQSPAIAYEGIMNGADETAVKENVLFNMGAQMKEWAAEKFPRNPEFQERVLAKIADGMGSAATFMSVGRLSQAISSGSKLWSFASTAYTGAAVSGANAYEVAKNDGATDDEAFEMYLWSSLIGVSEAIPVQRWMNNLDRSTGGGVRNILKEGFKGGLEELIQETFQQYAESLVAEQLEIDGFAFGMTKEDFIATFAVGGLMSGGSNVIGEIRQNAKRISNDQASQMLAKDLDRINENAHVFTKDMITIKDIDNAIEDLKEDIKAQEALTEQMSTEEQQEASMTLTVELQEKLSRIEQERTDRINYYETLKKAEAGTLYNRRSEEILSREDLKSDQNYETRTKTVDGVVIEEVEDINPVTRWTGIPERTVWTILTNPKDHPTMPGLGLSTTEALNDPLYRVTSGLVEADLARLEQVKLDDIFLDSLENRIKDMSNGKADLKNIRDNLTQVFKEFVQSNGKVNPNWDAQTVEFVTEIDRYFKDMRKKLQAHFKAEINRSIPKTLQKAFNQFTVVAESYKGKTFTDEDMVSLAKYFIMLGKTRSLEISKTDEKNAITLARKMRKYLEIDKYGYKNYIPKFSTGSYVIKSYKTVKRRSTGKEETEVNTVQIANSEEEAVQYLLELEKSGLVKKNTTYTIHAPGSVQRGKATHGADTSKINPEMFEQMVEEQLEQEETTLAELAHKMNRMLKRRAVKPVYAAPLSKRTKKNFKSNIDLLDQLRYYSFAVNRKLYIDPALQNMEIFLDLNRLPDQLKNTLTDLGEIVRGKYFAADASLDKYMDTIRRAVRFGLVKTFGENTPIFKYKGKGMSATRFAKVIRWYQAIQKLGIRPVAVIVNYIGGKMHSFGKAGPTYMRAAKEFLKTDQGKRLVLEEEAYLGVHAGLATEGEYGKGFRWAGINVLDAPLYLFSKVEPTIRKHHYAAMYLLGKDMYSLTDREAKAFARQAIRFDMFIYNASGLPRILRDPVGKVLGQFKSYLVNEFYFLKGLTKEQLGRYVGAMVTLGGPATLLYVLQSIPILNLLGFEDLYDNIDEWLGDFASGLMGMAGMDFGTSLAPQVPGVGDVFGATGSDIENVLEVAFEWEGAYVEDKVHNLAVKNIPFYNKASQWYDAYSDENGWVKDPRTGERIFRLRSWWDYFVKGGLMADTYDERLQKRLLSELNRERARYDNWHRNFANSLTKKIMQSLARGEDNITLDEEDIETAKLLMMDLNKVAEIRTGLASMTPAQRSASSAKVRDALMQLSELTELLYKDKEFGNK